MKSLFEEFLSLSWHGYGVRSKGDTVDDIILGDYIIARVSSSGILIIWLVNGNKVKIPWEWLDIFTSFNAIHGERVLWLNKSEVNDKIDEIIYKFTLLVNQFNWGKGKEFLETLADICSIGTSEFREWFNTESGEKLRPIELSMVENTIII